MKSVITILTIVISCIGHAEQFSAHNFVWARWNVDTTYYDSTNVINTIHRYKLMRKSRGTNWITKHKITCYDINGNWYLKEKTITDAGCFHFENKIIWIKERKQYVPADEQRST